MRHRQKLTPVFLLLLGMVFNNTFKKNKKRESEGV